MFRIKKGFYLKFLMPQTMKLLGSTEKKKNRDKNGKDLSHLETTEVVLVHCNVVNNNYQEKSRVFYTFAPNKSFGQLLDISPENFIYLRTFNSEFSYIEVWLMDQNFKSLEIEDKTNITLIIK